MCTESAAKTPRRTTRPRDCPCPGHVPAPAGQPGPDEHLRRNRPTQPPTGPARCRPHHRQPLRSVGRRRLADCVGVSERQLNRLFVEYLGVTPGRYVRRARTEAAARLLATTSLPISAVARQCGFGIAETLRQAFVQHYEISPSRYRLAHGSPARRLKPKDIDTSWSLQGFRFCERAGRCPIMVGRPAGRYCALRYGWLASSTPRSLFPGRGPAADAVVLSLGEPLWSGGQACSRLPGTRQVPPAGAPGSNLCQNLSRHPGQPSRDL